MRKVVAAILCFLASAGTAFAGESRINFNYDWTVAILKSFGHQQVVSWYGAEVDYEREWHKDKWGPSGFALGVRKEGKARPDFSALVIDANKKDENVHDGTYFTAKVFRRVKAGGWYWYPTAGLVYGMPGTRFDKTWERMNGSELVGYTHIFPMRNVSAPRIEVKKAAMVYPTVEMVLRRNAGRFNFDGIVGAKIICLGSLDTDFVNVKSETHTALMPTAGVRIGFRF